MFDKSGLVLISTFVPRDHMLEEAFHLNVLDLQVELSSTAYKNRCTCKSS
jgi:hypothetical protein